MAEQDEKQRRQSAVGRSLSATGDAAMKPVRATGSAMQRSAGLAGNAARKSVDISTDAATAGLDALQAAYNKGIDTVFPECPVPAFMLPTGPAGDDYVLTFDLRKILNDLRSGILVRPQIEVWAATAENHEIGYLAESLAVRFQEDFNAAKTAIAAAGNREIALHQGEETALVRDFWSELWGPTLGSAAFWTFALGILPPVGLLLLWMGQRPRIEVFGIVSRYLRSRSNRIDAEKDLEREVKRLETDFKRKRKAFERAVSNLEIRVHPRLQEIAASFGSTSGGHEEIPGGKAEKANYPDVEPYLKHPVYLQALRSQRAVADDSSDSTESEESSTRGFFRKIFGGA